MQLHGILKMINTMLVSLLNFFKVSVLWVANAIKMEKYRGDIDESGLNILTEDVESKRLVIKKIILKCLLLLANVTNLLVKV